jgi:exopolysaccharide biosynthesis polyprenyl glycosylphosphotransferase
MFKVFADRSFNDTVYTQQMRFALIMWVVRNKIVNDVKRLVDVLISLVALPLAMPIMIVTAIAIKLDSHGPVFFMQNRVGKWGKPFKCYKFRSMYVDAEARKAELMHLNEADEIVFKIADDPRVTRVGRIIRKLSIDEVPQIFNVLRGEMSWVGPRPPVPSEVAQYAYDQMMRLTVTPGITGLQQVSGRSTLSFNRWIELDLEYIQQQSLAKDIEILVKTIPAVISGKGAF